MLLDELIAVDLKEFTIWKIIFSHYRNWWLMFLAALFFCVGGFFFLALFLSSYLGKVVCLVLMLNFFWFTLLFSKQKTLSILTMHSEQYGLPTADLWGNRKIAIEKIRMAKLSEFLDQNPRLSNAKIRYFIEELSFRMGLPGHQSQFSQITISLTSVVLAGFFTLLSVVKDLFKSFNALVVVFKPYVGILLMFLLLYWFFDRIVLTWFFEIKQDKLTRLRRLLGNYLAERL